MQTFFINENCWDLNIEYGSFLIMTSDQGENNITGIT
jgi:hypothetical protein